MSRVVLVTLCASLALMVTPARAEDDAPESVTTVYSDYELAAIKQAEHLFESQVDPEPEGKIVESIDTLRLDPIEERDPAPLALNAAHVTTKESVVKHEVLLRVGEPYKKVLADEGARNLRRFAYMTIIIAVPLRGSRPDRVRLVMITKDVWSLIADVDVQVSAGGPEEMMFEVEENNVAGRQLGLSARTVIQPESYSLGADLSIPRFAGRFLSFDTEANVILNRRSGEPEGGWGDARIEQPLFSTRTAWSWGISNTWDTRIFRRYTNAEVGKFVGSNGAEIPFLWRSRRIDETAHLTRSFGWAHKNDFTLGVTAVHDVYRVPDTDKFDPTVVNEFKTAVVPVGETRVHPFAQWRTYGNDFLRILDFETLGLQEDYRLGYDVVFRGYPVLRVVGSSRNLLGARLGASYTIKMGDGFVRGLVDTKTELQFGVGKADPIEGTDEAPEDSHISDGSWHGEIRIVSPRTPLGRLVWDIDALNRYRNFLNRISQVGGEDRLRGWPTRYFVGKNTFNMNLEWRTRPVEIFSVMLGAAFFYDVGKAFNDDFDEIMPAQSVGAGFRIVLPQVDRAVLRGDFGFPMTAGNLPADVAPMSFFFSFGQAFRIAHQPAPLGP